MGIFVVCFFALVFSYLAIRIGVAIGRRAPTFIIWVASIAALLSSFYWLFVWQLQINEGTSSGVAILWLFARAFGTLCILAAGSVLYGASTRASLPPDG
jgi:hypothetical protein